LVPPKNNRKGSDNLKKAADDLIAAGPEEGRKEKLLEAADEVSGLVDTAIGLIPGAVDETVASQPAEPKEGLGDGKGGAADQLAQFAADNAAAIPQDQVDLARAIDRARNLSIFPLRSIGPPHHEI